MVLFYGNPDRYDGDWLEAIFDSAGPFAGDTGLSGVRPDGYNSRPAYTSSGGNALLRWHANKPNRPTVNSRASKFRVGGRYLWEAWPADPICIAAAVAFQGDAQVSAVINPDGTLSIYRGIPGAGTELKAGAAALSLNTFYKIGFAGSVAKAGGFAEIWIDRTRVLTYPNQPDSNTEYQEGFFWNGFIWGLVDGCAVNHIYGGDDYGHQMGDGPAPEKIVAFQYGIGNGIFTGWASNSGAMYAAVSEHPPDGDTTRITGAASGARFSVDLSTASVPARLVHAMQDTALVKVPDDDVPVGVKFLNVDEGGLGLRSHITLPGGGADYQAVGELYYQRTDNGESMDEDYVNGCEAGLELEVG